LREGVGITEFSPTEQLKDIKLIGSAIMECLIENDSEGVMEVIETHLEAMNKSSFLKEAGIPRSTLYKLFKTKNPTIKTLAKIIHAAYHAQD
jgi:DNA-binding phage protein